MKHSVFLVGTLCILFAVSGCNTTPEDTSTTSSTTTTTTTTTTTIPVIRQFTINLYDAGYTSAEINYYNGGAWTASPVAMTNGGTWWTIQFTATNDIVFYFRLNGLTWYPGNSGQSYRASLETVWIKNGILFSYDPEGPIPTNEIAVLTLNLHTYQETDPRTKLNYVAQLIAEGNIDMIAFQECAQHMSSNVVTNIGGVNIKDGNMALYIVDLLQTNYSQPYDFYWNWSHYGWTVWEEGSAVICRTNFALLEYERKYISTSTSTTSIDSRTAIFGRIAHPMLGEFNLFSTHVSWGAPQNAQLDALKAFAASKTNASTGATLLCGDYNMNYNTTPYKYMLADGWYDDAYKTIQPMGCGDITITENTRIDYQFLSTNSHLVPVTAQRVFTHVNNFENTFKQVSDHFGVVIRYRVE